VKINVFDPAGKLIVTHTTSVQRGNNTVTIDDLADKPRGMYMIAVYTEDEIFWQRLLLVK
jgi:uncharacterized protein YfaS (alpha-2-macroglobulin family)